MWRNFFKKDGFFKKAVVFALILLVINFIYYIDLRIKNVKLIETKFKASSNHAISRFVSTFSNYESTLHTARAFFNASDLVRRDEWMNFHGFLNNEGRHPGFSTIAFIRKIESGDIDKFINSVRADKSLNPQGNKGFDIFPKREKETNQPYLVADYIYPSGTESKAFGFDMASSEQRLNALEKARDLDVVVSTAPLDLIGNKRGFLTAFPVYDKEYDARNRSTFHRREHLEGLVISVFTYDKLFEHALNGYIPEGRVAYRIRDKALGEVLAAKNYDESKFRDDFVRHKVDVTVGTRIWEIEFVLCDLYSSIEVDRASEVVVLILGSGLSLLVVFFAYKIAHKKRK